MRAAQLPQREGVASGASVMNLRDDDEVVAFLQRPLDGKITVSLSTGRVKEFGWDAIQVGHRDMRGTKLSIQGEVKEVAAAATVVQ